MTVQIRTVEEPFDNPAAVRSAVGFLSRAETMGFLGEETVDRLDVDVVRAVVDAMADAGLGTGPGAVLSLTDLDLSDQEAAELLATLEEILEGSPAPGREWARLEQLFSIERLAGLVGVSAVSVRRYAKGERSTPDPVAARLHFLAMVVSDLAGAYNDFGIRRWFSRPRRRLESRAPEDLLVDGWDPDDPGPATVRALARSLTGSPAT